MRVIFPHSVVTEIQCTLWKNQKFTLTEKIFRQINYLVISLVKTLLSRNFCQKRVRVNFHNFHTVLQPHRKCAIEWRQKPPTTGPCVCDGERQVINSMSFWLNTAGHKNSHTHSFVGCSTKVSSY